MKHQPQRSPGSSERMMGCFVAWKCLVACLFFELSQQPTWPHYLQSRRCTQVSPIFRHSSQPWTFALTLRIWSVCVQTSTIGPPAFLDSGFDRNTDFETGVAGSRLH